MRWGDSDERPCIRAYHRGCHRPRNYFIIFDMAGHSLMFGRLYSRRSMRDNTTFTTAQIVMSPRILATVVFFYIFLVLFQISLIVMIRINKITFGDFSFHCRAVELLHYTRVLLNMKNYR